MSILTVGKIVLGLLPVISQTVADIEDLDQTSGKGAAKRALALNLIRAAYEAGNPSVSFDDLKATIEKVIGAVVEFYKAIGKFIGSITAPAAA